MTEISIERTRVQLAEIGLKGESSGFGWPCVLVEGKIYWAADPAVTKREGDEYSNRETFFREGVKDELIHGPTVDLSAAMRKRIIILSDNGGGWVEAGENLEEDFFSRVFKRGGNK